MLIASLIKMKQKYIILFLAFLQMAFISGCKNYHNEMLEWSSKIPAGTDFVIVKKDQPKYLEVDWGNPDTLENGMTRYIITEIKGNNDILHMQYFIEFENNKFRGVFAHK